MNNDNCPIIIGVGQITESVPKNLNQASSNSGLAAKAANLALLDAKDTSLASHIDTIAISRAFADSMPGYPKPFGMPNNLPRAIAKRINANPVRAIYPDAGGEMPQKLVNEFAELLGSGKSKLALMAGAEALKTIRAAMKQGATLDWSETVEGSIEDRGLNLSSIISQYEVQHNMDMAVLHYALIENARRADKQQSHDTYMQDMAETFSKFSRVAAKNPYANDQTEYDAEFLATPTEKNPLIVSPYTKGLIAKESVNQGAAILMSTVGYARELGIDENKWIYLHGYCTVKDTHLLERSNLAHSAALEQTLQGVLSNAGKTSREIAHFDFYSCFPIVVTQCRDMLNLAPDDPRALTQTGGLPFFGGPGNNYSMHGIAATIETLRQDPGSYGLVLANGGFLSKFSAGIYSTSPTGGWLVSDSSKYQKTVDNGPKTEIDGSPNGAAVIETYTVHYLKGAPVRAIVIGRMQDTSKRFYALVSTQVSTQENETMQRLITEDAIGQPITVTSNPKGNRFVFSSNQL